MRKHFRAVVAFMLVISLVLGIAPTDLIAEWSSAAQAAPASGNTPAGLESLLEDAAELKAKGQILSSGDWQYVLLPGSGYAVITGYTGESASSLAVPDLLDGADTVGILDGALNSLKNVRETEIPGNVLAIGKDALPAYCTIRSVSGSYAQAWAKKNRHAYSTTSSYEFMSGVVDLTGIRPENFVRVSENEVILRPLEALRLQERTVFFLIDPANPYQISYYRAVSLEETGDGFVTVRCETPDINELLYRYESAGEQLQIDLSSVRLYEGATLNTSGHTRSTGFNTSAELSMGLDTTIDAGIGKLKINGQFTNSYNAKVRVGFGVKDEITVTESQKAEFSLALSSKTDKEKTEEGDSFGDLLEEKVKEARKTKQSQYLDAPMGSAVVFSLWGFVNLSVSLRYVFEYTGEVKISFTYSNETTYSYKEGQGITKSSNPGEKKWEGSVSGKIKTGIELEVALYLAVVKVASISIFCGLKAEAKYSVEFSDTTLAALDHMYGKAGSQFELAENVNLNMLDCITITVTAVLEFGASLGATDNLTLVSLRVPLEEVKIGSFHLHFYGHPILQEPIRDDSGNAVSYRYTIQGTKKHPFHFASDCPYKTFDVKFVLPYQNNLELKSIKNLAPGTTVDKPEFNMIENYHRKLVSWHTSSSMSKESKVSDSDWPYAVQKNTTFFAKTSPLHDLLLLDANGSGLGYETLSVRDTDASTRTADFNSGLVMVAEGESFNLPSELPDKSEIVMWIPVNSRFDLHQPEHEASLQPGALFSVTSESKDTVTLCALTDHDIQARFYYNDGQYDIVNVTRGQPIPVPPGPDNMVLYRFLGWTDKAGSLVTDSTYPTDENTPSLLTFRMKRQLTDFSGVIPLEEIAIGEEVPEYGTPSPYSDHLELDYHTVTDENTHSVSYVATVTGFNEDPEDPQYMDLIIPGTAIRVEDGTAIHYTITTIQAGAFRNKDKLRTVHLPDTISSIGRYAFAECDNLEMINMSLCSVTSIPEGFAENCKKLKSVVYSSACTVTIGYAAFRNCKALTRARIAGNISESAFEGCTGLTAVILENRIMRIDDYAFMGCSNLASLAIPDTVFHFGSHIILGCTNLTTLEINAMDESLPSGVFDIGEGSMLSTLVLGSGVTGVDSGCFSNGGYGFTRLVNLTINGTAAIGADAFSGSSVRTLTLNSGGIGSGAFRELPALETIVIGDGVTDIGPSAFASCPALKTVTIGENVSFIGSSAFRNCSALETVTFSNSRLKSIGERAFENCTSLAALVIPETVTSYGDYLIRGCTGLQTLSVGSGVSGIDSSYVFFIGFQDQSLKTLIVREGVTSIPDYAFSNGHSSASGATGLYALEEIVLPSTLRTIGREAFWKAGMKKLTVRSAVSLNSSAFAYCDRLEELEYNAGSIADYAFRGCTSLRKVTVGDAVSSIGQSAFEGCAGLREISIGCGVTSIGDFAFQNCTSLTSLTIPDQVQSIGICFLSGCSGLTTLSIGSVISTISNFHISSDSLLTTVILREGVTSLGENAFRNNYSCFPNLTTVSFPASLTFIGSAAFRDTKLTGVTLRSDVAIGSDAFFNCDRLQSVSMQGGTIGGYAFQNCSALTSFTMGDVTSIGDYAFQGCGALKSLTIPDSVTRFKASALEGCSGLEYLSIGAAGDNQAIGVSLKKSGTSGLKTLVLREGITKIPSYDYSDMPCLTDVSFPSTLESVGSYAFRGTAVRKVEITGNTEIGDCAFKNCRYLTEVNIGCGSIGSEAFRNCVSLRSFTLRLGSGRIGSYAFDNCIALEKAVLGDGVTELGSEAFMNCKSLTALAIPDSVRSYSEYMIRGCTSLRTLSVGGGFIASGYSYSVNWNAPEIYSSSPACAAFYIGPESSLEHVAFAEGVTVLYNWLLANADPNTGEIYGFPSLRSVSLPDSLAKVGTGVLCGSSVTDLRLGGTVEVSDSAFTGMRSLRHFSMAAGTIGKYALKDLPALTSVSLGEGVTSVGEEAFAGCTALGSLYFPDSVTDYGKHIIMGCTGLRNLSLGAGFQTPSVNQFNRLYIGENAMLEWVEIREGVTILYEDALANTLTMPAVIPGFPRLHTLCLPASLEQLGNNTVTACPNLRHLYLKSADVLLNYYDEIYYAEDLPAGLNIYTETRNDGLAEFCLAHHLNYIVRGDEDYPAWQLTLAVPEGKTQASGGSLDASFAILSRSQTAYAAALDLPSPVPVSGYVFRGWYTDPGFTCAWTGTEMPARDLTLYARIEKAVDLVFAVNLPSAGSPDSSLPSGFSVYQSFALRPGDLFPVPQEPLAEYYAFAGWYTDPDFTVPCRLSVVPEQDTVVYGRMDRLSAGAEYTAVPGGLRLTRYVLQEGESFHLELPARISGVPVVSIAADAFADCAAHSIRIPETVTEIAEGAFRSDHLFRLRVAADNPAYIVDNGILYDVGRTILLYCTSEAAFNYYTRLPSTLRRISAYAFAGNTGLSSVPFPDGLEEIGPYAFDGCTSLYSVTLPDSVVRVQRSAFRGCSGLDYFRAAGLTDLEYMDEQKGLFYETLPDNGILRVYGPVGTGVLREACLISDSTGAKHNFCYNLYSLTGVINGSYENMYCEAGQKLDQLLAETVLEDGTVICGWFKDSALTNPWNLDTDVMPTSSLTLYASSAPPFTYRTGEVTDKNGTAVSGAILTRWNGAAASLAIPASIDSHPVVGLDAGFLGGAFGLSGLAVPSSVVFIDEEALTCADGPFSGTVTAEPDSYAARWAAAHSLAGDEPVHTVSFVSDGETVMTLEAVQGSPILLPVLETGGRTFTGWSTVSYSFSPPQLAEDDVYIMPGRDVTLYAFWEGAEQSVFTWVLTSAGEVTVTGYTGSSPVIAIPSQISGYPVTAVGDRAFENRPDLTRVILPDTLTGLGGYAFSNCSALRECVLPDSLLRIGDYALAGTALSSVTVPDSVVSLGKGAFSGCADLYSLHLGLNVLSLTADDLDGCSRLHILTVTQGSWYLKAVDNVLFTADGFTLLCYPCNRGAAAYTVPDGTVEIAARVFRSNPDLESVTLPASVMVIGNDAFTGCLRLARFSAGGLLEIGDRAFFGCHMLSDVTLSSCLQSIGTFAFVSASSLRALALPSTLQLNPDRMVFDNDTGLVITGTAGSSVQDYARVWGLAFVDPDAPSAASVALSASELTMELGTSALLTASVLPENAGSLLSWSSDKPDVVRVENGTLYAVGTGSTVVTVSADNGVSASCAVTVSAGFRSVRINLLPALKVGETARLSAITDPDVPAVLSWASSNPSVAAVDASSGLLTAAGVGSATVTVTTENGKTGSLPITVYRPVTGVTVSAPSDHMYAVPGNNTLQLTASVQPADATFTQVSWSSSDLSVAIVDQSGLVTARKAGTIVITAASDDPETPSASFSLTVDLFDLSGGTFFPASASYNGEYFNSSNVTGISVGGLVLDKSHFSASWSGNTPKDAGEYTGTVTGNGTTTTGQFTGTFTVTRAEPRLILVDQDRIPAWYLWGTEFYTITPEIKGAYAEITCRQVLADGSLGEVISGVPEFNGTFDVTAEIAETQNVAGVSVTRRYRLWYDDEIFAPSAITLPLGAVGKLPVSCEVADTAPYWYSIPEFSLSSSDPSVVSVSSGNTLTALSAGTAVITIRETNNTYATTECTVTVLDENRILALPAALLEIGEEAFMGDASVRYVRVSSGTKRIGPKAFADMAGLVFVEIPASVRSIADDAFAGSTPVLLCSAGSWADNYAVAKGILHFSR